MLCKTVLKVSSLGLFRLRLSLVLQKATITLSWYEDFYCKHSADVEQFNAWRDFPYQTGSWELSQGPNFDVMRPVLKISQIFSRWLHLNRFYYKWVRSPHSDWNVTNMGRNEIKNKKKNFGTEWSTCRRSQRPNFKYWTQTSNAKGNDWLGLIATAWNSSKKIVEASAPVARSSITTVDEKTQSWAA